jgi:hypothetical protein
MNMHRLNSVGDPSFVKHTLTDSTEIVQLYVSSEDRGERTAVILFCK